MKPNIKDRLRLIGQIIAHARTNRKVLTEGVLSAMRRIEKKAEESHLVAYDIDRYINEGKDIYYYQEGKAYGKARYLNNNV